MLKIKLVIGFVVLSLIGCSEQEEKKRLNSQVAAIVNDEDITVHQINNALLESKITIGSDTDQKAIANRILNKLIERTVVHQAAIEQGLTRDPDVVSAIELAKVRILNEAYLSKRIQKNTNIPVSEINQYFEDNPHMFSDRRLFEYTLLRVKANQEEKKTFVKQLEELSDLDVFRELLGKVGVSYTESRELVSSENMVELLVKPMYALNVGDIGFLSLPDGLLVIQLNAVMDKPVSLEEAKSGIVRFLQSKKQQQDLKNIIKYLKNSAKVEYVGDYAAPEVAPDDLQKSEAPVIN